MDLALTVSGAWANRSVILPAIMQDADAQTITAVCQGDIERYA